VDLFGIPEASQQKTNSKRCGRKPPKRNNVQRAKSADGTDLFPVDGTKSTQSMRGRRVPEKLGVRRGNSADNTNILGPEGGRKPPGRSKSADMDLLGLDLAGAGNQSERGKRPESRDGTSARSAPGTRSVIRARSADGMDIFNVAKGSNNGPPMRARKRDGRQEGKQGTVSRSAPGSRTMGRAKSNDGIAVANSAALANRSPGSHASNTPPRRAQTSPNLTSPRRRGGSSSKLPECAPPQPQSAGNISASSSKRSSKSDKSRSSRVRSPRKMKPISGANPS